MFTLNFVQVECKFTTIFVNCSARYKHYQERWGVYTNVFRFLFFKKNGLYYMESPRDWHFILIYVFSSQFYNKTEFSR